MWHREDAESCGPGWRFTTPQMDSNTEELNSKLAEANVKFRHQNAELVGANFKLRKQNVQLRRWCDHLGKIVASQKKRIKSIQAGLEEVRTERDNLLAAGRHFDAILHRGMVCTAPPAPRAEFVPRPATTVNMSIPNSGGEVDRTVSGVWLDGFLSPLPNCDPTTRSSSTDYTPKQNPTTRSPSAEYTPKQKEDLRRYLLTQRGPANARDGGRRLPISLATGSSESLQKANGPVTSLESSSRSSDSSQEACVRTANTSALVTSLRKGSPTWAPKAEVAPVSEEALLMSSTETSGKCIRAPCRGIIVEGPSASPKNNFGPDLPEETLRVSSTEPSEKQAKPLAGNVNDNTTESQVEKQDLGTRSHTWAIKADVSSEERLLIPSTESSEKWSKPLVGNVSDTTTGAQDGGQVLRGPCKSGNLGNQYPKGGDNVSGGDGPGGETDDGSLEGPRTETDEPGVTEHDSETHSIDPGDFLPGVCSLDEHCRSERNTEVKPGASSLHRPSAQISGDETGILDSRNSKPASGARTIQNGELIIAGSGSAADPLKIDEPESVEPCDVSTDSAGSRRTERSPAVIASRTACPPVEETSMNAPAKLNASATLASSAWLSRYPNKLYSRNPTNDSGSCVNNTSVGYEISSDRYTHVTHCCWCFNERLELQAVALCEGCPRIICRQCMLKVGLRVPSGDNSRDSILPASSCRCVEFDSKFRKPPPTAQPEAHLIEELWRHDLSLQFREPVDTESNPNYLSVITKEKMMDLATMAERMKNRCYQTPRGQRKFLLDLQQIWSNCWKYAQYDPEDQAPMPGIVSCTMILANMVDEYCKSNMEVPTLTLDEKSWLAARENLKQTKFCEMVKGNPHTSMILPVNAKQGVVEEHWTRDDLTKRVLPSSSGSTSVKRTFSSLSSPEDNSSDPEDVVSGTLINLADVGDRLVQEAKRRRETRNVS